MRTFSSEPIQIGRKKLAPVTSNGLFIPAADFIVVAEEQKSVIGRNLFDQLGLDITIVWTRKE